MPQFCRSQYDALHQTAAASQAVVSVTEPPSASAWEHYVQRYTTLGVRRVINADARLTRLGGSCMPEPVLDAMRAAASQYVDMFELQEAVGAHLAQLTRNDAACVTTGAAAGLFLSTLACLTGPDQAAVNRMPDRTGVRHEVLVQRAQEFAYLPAVPLAGATLVRVGSEPEMHPAELDAAISKQTAAVLFVAGAHMAPGALSLPEVVAVAHARGVPVIVDAAAQLPPPENFWRFTRDEGADLAVFSGGKDLQGPQASGLVVGRPDLVEACRMHAAPHARLARPMKVGKEEMLGLLAAVEWYLDLDHDARIAGFERTVAEWIDAFEAVPGLRASREFPNEAGQPMPRCLVEFDPALNLGATDAAARLWEGDPRVAVKTAGAYGLSITPDTLAQSSDADIVQERIIALLHVHASG